MAKSSDTTGAKNPKTARWTTRDSSSGRFMDTTPGGGVVKHYSMPDGTIVPRLKPGVIDRANAALRSK